MALLVLVFIVVPVAELYVIVQTSHALGLAPTLGLLVAVSVVGAWLVKRQGLAIWRRFNTAVRQGVVPSREIVDGVTLLVAGALLVVPGFITDAIGVALLLPPVRIGVRTLVLRRSRQRHTIMATYSGPSGPAGPWTPGGVIDAPSHERD
jgi:UPF0716 protein FxsA